MAVSATVRDVMSDHVIAAAKTASFKELARLLREQRVSAFPVVDGDGRVIGVVSEADLLAKLALGGDTPPKMMWQRLQDRAAGVTAADLMSAPPVTIGPDEPVTSAARLMYNVRVKRLPVTDADGRLVGIVARSDVLSVYSRPDEEIGREIQKDVILDKFLCDPARFRIEVRGGIVTIGGTPETAAAGHDIIAAARHVEGVVAVRDRLAYPPRDRRAPAGA